MPVSPGTSFTLLVYDTQGTRYARGFAFAKQEEFEVELSPSLPRVSPGDMITFVASGTNHHNWLIPQQGTLVSTFEPDLCRKNGAYVEMAAHILFSERTKDMVYSPEYGWIYFSKKYTPSYSVTNLYKTYIQRDEEKKDRGLLFSVCSSEELFCVENDKKVGNYRQQLQEAEVKRFGAEPNYPSNSNQQKTNYSDASNRNKRHGSGRSGQQHEPWKLDTAPKWQEQSQSEIKEKELKKAADTVSLFLILRLADSPKGQDKGVAWAMRLRGLGLHTTFVNGQSEMLDEACWYEGVCKWNRKFTRTYEGYYVEKIYKRTQFPPFPTTLNKTGNKPVVEITTEINFSDDLHEEQRCHSDKVVLKNFRIFAVEVSKRLYKKHYGRKCMCILANKVSPNKSDTADWEVLSIKDDLGPAEDERAGWSSSQAPTDMAPLEDVDEEEDDEMIDGEDDGAPPDFDDDDAPRRAQLPIITNVPNRDARQPQPRYAGDQPHQQDNERAYSERPHSRHSGSSQRGNTYLGLEIERITYPVPRALVVMTSKEGKAVIYANEAKEGILAIGIRLTLGAFITLKVLKLVHPAEGGLHYIAINETVRPIAGPEQLRIFTPRDGACFVDTNCPMEYTKPIKGGYQLYSLELGPIFSSDILPHEQGDTTSISDMKNGAAGKNWRIWAQFCHHVATDGQEGFHWEAMKVRGPAYEVDRYENQDVEHYYDIFDDIDIDKQHQHMAAFGMIDRSRPGQPSWETMNDHRNNDRDAKGDGRSMRDDRSSRAREDWERYTRDGGRNMNERNDRQNTWDDGRSARDDSRSTTTDWQSNKQRRNENTWNDGRSMRDDRSTTSRDDWRHDTHTTRTETRTSAQPALPAERTNGTMPDELFAKMWSILQVQRSLKQTDYDLYCEIETIAEQIKEKKLISDRRLGDEENMVYRTSNFQKNDQDRYRNGNGQKEFSRVASEMGGSKSSLRQAFHGGAGGSSSQSQYDRVDENYYRSRHD